MERLRRIERFWNWLPVFQAVGETGHLPSAAEMLRVSASALSRSIRLLEKDLGVELFQRTGRRLELTPAGRDFLQSVREAMQLVHGGLQVIHAEQVSGEVRILSAGVITTAFVIPALASLKVEYPDLIPSVLSEIGDPVNSLLSGKLDVAFSSMFVTDPRLSTVHLGSVTSGVYCGEGHPLYGKRKLSLDQVTAYPFVGPPRDKNMEVVDGWPRQYPREFGMHVDRLTLGKSVCQQGQYLAVLPDPVALGGDGAAPLHRLPIEDFLPGAELIANHRPARGENDRAMVVIDAVRRSIKALAMKSDRRPRKAKKKRVSKMKAKRK